MIKLVWMFEKNQKLMLLPPPPTTRHTLWIARTKRNFLVVSLSQQIYLSYAFQNAIIIFKRFVLCTIFGSTYQWLYIFFIHSMKDSERLSRGGPALVKKTYMFKIFLKCIRLHRILMWIFWLSDVLCAFHKCKIFHTQINVAPSHINSKWNLCSITICLLHFVFDDVFF